MPISQQMQSIVDSIATFKAGLQAKMAEQDDESREILDPMTFSIILSGLPSFRRLPGVPDHMGFDDGYVCDSDEHAEELKNYLESVFGITDAESLDVQRREFFHIFNEYYDFACEWDGHPNFTLDDLDEEARTNYTVSRDFALYLRDLVGQQGFLAWDVGERIMLARAAHACGIINADQCAQMIASEARICNELFDNFVDFAISALCGCVYYMFISMGRSEEEGLSGFLDINMKIVTKLIDDGIWALNSWCEKNYKELAIKTEQIQQLLPESYKNITAIAADRILCEGYRISVMLREQPNMPTDSGWRFFAGDEDQDYIMNPQNFGALDINLIANYSPDIISFLEMPVGTFVVRDENGVLQVMKDEDNPLNPDGTPKEPIAYG